MKKELFPSHIRFIVWVYIISLIAFTLFRLIFLSSSYINIQELPEGEKLPLIIKAFVMGMRFDMVISGYFTFFPLVILMVCSFLRFNKTVCYNIVTAFLIVVFIIGFLICSIDIPYFNQFFARLTAAAFVWVDTPSFMLKMIFNDFTFWWPIIPLIIICVIYSKVIWQLNKKILHIKSTGYFKNIFAVIGYNLVLSLLTLSFIFLGIRGRITKKSPIRVGTAYFSNYAYPNMLGLNPVFTLGRSWLDSYDDRLKNIKYMDDQEAIKNVINYLKIQQNSEYNSPIARMIVPDDTLRDRYNIVIIMMESMGTSKIKSFGGIYDLTPCLDSIASESLMFTNFYSSGRHTHNGIYSTLFSFPSVKYQHALKSVNMNYYNGIAYTLKKYGYYSMYFTTHDDQFDNIGGFLSANYYNKIIAQKDYPKDMIKGPMGVPDDYLFDFSIPVINKVADKNQNFLAAFLTGSDHRPFYIPDYFHPRSDDDQLKIIEYADWSIGKFLRMASKESWFENTIFLILADHGCGGSSTYDVRLSYNQSPLIIHCDKLINENKKIDHFGGQIDVFPTVMGLLKLPYLNNTLGIDLLNETRPYMYFNADADYGVINNDFYFVQRGDGEASLYKYREQDIINSIKDYQQLADSMKLYAESMMQVSQYLIENNLTFEDK